MSDPSTTRQPPVVSRDALRIVLFGMPDAGKSSLLGALAQAAQTQEHLLNGHLTDSSHGLTELQRRLYEEQPRETLEEVVPYPVTFEPFTRTPTETRNAQPEEALLVDCDGRVANDLLSRRRSLDAGSAEGSLAGAILEADALVLAIDASATADQVDSDFAEFGRFLRLLEQHRGQRTEVGGLPAFLVLTKCDLLARPNDAQIDWVERVEERKREVDHRFQEFLARQRAAGPVPFGRIDLHLWATAVKRPALTNGPARPREPYGVAELFRQALEQARSFRARRDQSSSRLRRTVAGAAGVAVVMAGLAVALLTGRDANPPIALENKVASFRAGDESQTTAYRLRERSLDDRIHLLAEVQRDPDFERLKPEQRQYVEARLQELQAYRDYLRKLRDTRSPADARTETDLDEIRAALSEAPPPTEYQEEWEQTEAVLLRKKRLEDVEAIRDAITKVENWYQDLKRRGDDLAQFETGDGTRVSWVDWPNRVEKLLSDSRSSRFQASDRLPGSHALPGLPEVTYATVFRFEPVLRAQNDWEEVKKRLERLQALLPDLSAALGLAGMQPNRPALLEFPRPPDFRADQIRARLQKLESVYPRFRDWTVPADLPPALVRELRQAAEVNYQNLLRAGQEIVLKQLQRLSPDGREKPERWRELANTTPDLSDWSPLAQVLARLADPQKPDPVAALTAFLRRDRFELDLRGLTLQIPDDLRVRPVGKLSIYHRSGGEAQPPLLFRIRGEGRRDAKNRVTRYALEPETGATPIYRPGDSLWAELPLRDKDNRDMLFTWSACRSLVYQLERLVRPPRLHRKDQENTAGDIAEGVLLLVPEGGIPAVPDLLPVVKLEKR